MIKRYLVVLLAAGNLTAFSQNVLTPEKLWSLSRVGAETISPDGKQVIYGVTNYDIATGSSERDLYSVAISGNEVKKITSTKGSEGGVMTLPNGKMGYLYKGQLWEAEWDGSNPVQRTEYEGGISNIRFSPDGKNILFSKDVQLQNVTANTIYNDIPNSNVRVYNSYQQAQDDRHDHQQTTLTRQTILLFLDTNRHDFSDTQADPRGFKKFSHRTF